ncbi:hypothetical protein QJS83_10095 [Bdellovibrio sp. 22V]|uniref:hypothetical protein n=1 Tax=Bdellovibrio TaxID=958 RepID=UPI0025427F56|nr:hypothetical protein [Bdellovibrio sp. 22V]WII70810.1 hypothetical protein QJS83_10095 [Bdellovibrio sp. 22V]
MKTKNMILNFFKALFLTAMTLTLVNCSKDSNSGNTVTTGYYMGANGICYAQNGQQMPNTSYCYNNNGYNTGYTWQANGTCVQTSTGMQVPVNYCQTNGYNNGTATMVCQGPHTDGYQWVQCGTQFNCAGYTLYNQSMQIVRCQ